MIEYFYVVETNDTLYGPFQTMDHAAKWIKAAALNHEDNKLSGKPTFAITRIFTPPDFEGRK